LATSFSQSLREEELSAKGGRTQKKAEESSNTERGDRRCDRENCRVV
jgi:hypothetical protein